MPQFADIRTDAVMLPAVTRLSQSMTVIIMPLSPPDLGAITSTIAIDRERLADIVLDFQRQANEVC
jgi:hypothetical protein